MAATSTPFSLLNPQSPVNNIGLGATPIDLQTQANTAFKVSQLSSYAPQTKFGLISASPGSAAFSGLNQSLTKQGADLNSLLQSAQQGQGNQFGVFRAPWVFATFAALKTSLNATSTTGTTTFPSGVQAAQSIVWCANPKSIAWVINQRGVESKNKSGSVLHLWRDRLRNSYYDDAKISITFQSGNLMPQSSQGSINPLVPATRDQIAGGLNNFYQYLSLVDSPKINSDGSPNLVYILYRSRIFPALILTGMFDPQTVVNFTDSVDSPNQVNNWTANFTVYSTTPRLNSFQELVSMFQSEGLTSPT